jgi:hypothetical protein
VLVDLSVGGAQVLCAKEQEVSRAVTMLLASGEVPVSCRGKVVWAYLEPHSKGRALRYRAGIVFTKVDGTAIEALIARHSAT